MASRNWVLPAVLALAGAAACSWGSPDWERELAETRRPGMPGGRTLAAWRESGGPETRTEEVVRAECTELAAGVLGASGAVLPEGAVWRTAFASDAERVEVAEFTDAAGRANRFAVYEQIGNQVPYYWVVEGSGADAVAERAGAVREVEGVLERGDVRMDELGEEVVPPYERFRFRFLDDAPGMDWIRPCRYLFEDADGSGFTVLWMKMPPRMRHRSTGEEIRWAGQTAVEVPPDEAENAGGAAPKEAGD